MKNFDVCNKNILIFGLGDSGHAAAALALNNNARVYVHDSHCNELLERRSNELEKLGATVFLNSGCDFFDQDFDLIIVSPGIADSSRLVRDLDRFGCEVIGELEFGYRFSACPILAVTGTNGKTTTIELLVHCLDGVGKRVCGAGNNGYPISAAAGISDRFDFLAVEVSSFQLDRIKNFSPYASALLNISEDHLDRYETLNDYVTSKLKLITSTRDCQKISMNHQLLNRPEITSSRRFDHIKPTTFTTNTSVTDADYFLDAGGTVCFRSETGVIPLYHCDELVLKGAHNVENTMAVLALTTAAGICHSEITPLIKTFMPGRHRQEIIGVRNGVTIINDSKSTNPDSMIQALLRFGPSSATASMKNIVLIAGGRNKDLNFDSVTPYIREYVKKVLLLGESQDLLYKIWSGHAPCQKFGCFGAVLEAAVDDSNSGDTILFSPGCASHDMFENYQQRGEIFSREIKRKFINE